jgi:hypothetical protein
VERERCNATSCTGVKASSVGCTTSASTIRHWTVRYLVVVPVEKVIRAGEGFRIGAEKVRTGTYTDAASGRSAR